MKNALLILLLMMLFPLMGEDRAPVVSAEPPPERLELLSYVHIGVEVRALSFEEFATMSRALPPRPFGDTVRLTPGEPAFLEDHEGLLVTRVVPGGPAEKAGIREGDLILYISGAPMEKPADLLSVLRNCSPGVPIFITLIREGKWQQASPRVEARPRPVVVGHIVPRKPTDEQLEKLKQHQARIASLLASEPVPLHEACKEMEAICRILHRGYTPGCLRLSFRSGNCCINATRYGWNIELEMQEDGVTTRAELQQQGDVLPESMRRRLQEMATPAEPTPRLQKSAPLP